MVDLILVVGKLIKCMGKVFLNGRMEGNMKATTLKIKNMVRDILNGRMEGNTLDNG